MVIVSKYQLPEKRSSLSVTLYVCMQDKNFTTGRKLSGRKYGVYLKIELTHMDKPDLIVSLETWSQLKHLMGELFQIAYSDLLCIY